MWREEAVEFSRTTDMEGYVEWTCLIYIQQQSHELDPGMMLLCKFNDSFSGLRIVLLLYQEYIPWWRGPLER